ncbi:MAG: isochorismatase family protein [Armatimonadetes bacterium]|nr:isochorismatase family protein [Armatimonadota bacterium]
MTTIRIEPTDALILVDVQVDFCPGGALAVPEGDQVVPVLNRLSPHFATVAATSDQHPANHCSFVAQGGLWPPHCVVGSPGADPHPDLDLSRVGVFIRKAFLPEVESFNNFAGEPDLAAYLRERGVRRIFVGGLATEYCVLNTVLGGLEQGFAAVAVTDAMRAVDVQPGDGDRALEQMRAAGAVLADSSEIVG